MSHIQVKDRFFQLDTKNSTYQMKVDKNGILLHLWYGSRVDEPMDYLLNFPDTGHSTQIPEESDNRTYSLELLPLEFPTWGMGDFRNSAISIRFKNGSYALDLRYLDHKITSGKYPLEGLPASYGNKAETLEIVLADTMLPIKVHLLYGLFYDEDVITRAVIIEGDESTALQSAASVCLDIQNASNLQMMHFYGRHNEERYMERANVPHAEYKIESKRGISSHQQNPAVILCADDTTETSGECIGAVLMYSGNFSASIEQDSFNNYRFLMGVNSQNFEWSLKDPFIAPEVILSYSEEGFSKLSRNFHAFIKNNVCRGKFAKATRPVLINNWEATYFDYDEEKIYEIAKQASKLGVDLMVLDDGWFGSRDDDKSSLGDWQVNSQKFPNGLESLISKVNKLGMKFGIWIEPECVSPNSKLYKEHPDWVLTTAGRVPCESRNQLVLDLSNNDAVDYLYNIFNDLISQNNIEYIKWDMNRSINDAFSCFYSAEKQGEVLHRYVLGLYSLLDRLTSAHPDVLFEGCTSGGGRFDAGMLYYTPQIWTSDNTDAFERCKIQYGTSFFYPTCAMGSHISASPNHQTGRATSLKTRSTVAKLGTFGLELDLSKLSEDELQQIKRETFLYKKYQNLIFNGDLYRLANPFEDNMFACEIVSPDKSEAILSVVTFTGDVINSIPSRVKLAGLDPDCVYLDDAGETRKGSTLMSGGYVLKKSQQDGADFVSYEVHFMACK